MRHPFKIGSVAVRTEHQRGYVAQFQDGAPLRIIRANEQALVIGLKNKWGDNVLILLHADGTTSAWSSPYPRWTMSTLPPGDDLKLALVKYKLKEAACST